MAAQQRSSRSNPRHTHSPVVTLWWARSEDWRDELGHYLTPAERSLQRRMLTSAGARSFGLGRVMTKLVVAQMTGCAPAVAVIHPPDDEGGTRRPEPARAGMSFSLARSGGLLLLATAAGYSVGVDLQHEWEITEAEIDAIVPPDEGRDLRRLLHVERRRAAARQWTRREAVLKVTGEGLRVRPSQLRMTSANEAPRLLHHPDKPGIGERLTLIDAAAPEGFQACLAVASSQRALVVHRRFSTRL